MTQMIEPLYSDFLAEKLGQSQQKVMSLTVQKRQLEKRLEKTEDRAARAIELLERIAGHDHQAAAIRVLRNPPTDAIKRREAYADCLEEVATTDIQGWVQMALLHLRGENADG
jgi:hypothetical protein